MRKPTKPADMIAADILDIATGRKHNINFDYLPSALTQLAINGYSGPIGVNVWIDTRLGDFDNACLGIGFPDLHFCYECYYGVDGKLDCVECLFALYGRFEHNTTIAQWEFVRGNPDEVYDNETVAWKLKPVWFTTEESLAGVYYLVARPHRTNFVRLLRYLASQNGYLQPQYEEVAKLTGRCCF